MIYVAWNLLLVFANILLASLLVGALALALSGNMNLNAFSAALPSLNIVENSHEVFVQSLICAMAYSNASASLVLFFDDVNTSPTPSNTCAVADALLKAQMYESYVISNPGNSAQQC